jgi:hypothetical protein
MFIIILWIAGGAVLSFAVSALFAGRMQLERNYYLLVYVPISAFFIAGFYLWSGTDIVAQFTTKWMWGVLGAAVVGFIAVRDVLKQQPYPRRRKWGFAIDLLWPGLAYGLADGMLLSVFPIMAVYYAAPEIRLTDTFLGGNLAVALAALAASLVITLIYHLGYPEFRGKQVLWTLVGNGLMSVAFLLTGNPIAAVASHIAMHTTSMVHGRETTLQLPPHYRKGSKKAILVS